MVLLQVIVAWCIYAYDTSKMLLVVRVYFLSSKDPKAITLKIFTDNLEKAYKVNYKF